MPFAAPGTPAHAARARAAAARMCVHLRCVLWTPNAIPGDATEWPAEAARLVALDDDGERDDERALFARRAPASVVARAQVRGCSGAGSVAKEVQRTRRVKCAGVQEAARRDGLLGRQLQPLVSFPQRARRGRCSRVGDDAEALSLRRCALAEGAQA